MRAITVRQPWAAAIVWWGKDVENRTRNIADSYRGLVAIHAGLVEDDSAYDDDMIRQALAEQDDSWTTQEQLETGVILGVVDLASVHHASDHGHPPCSSWGQRDAWHLILENPRPLDKPIPCRGQLGLWTPPPDVRQQIEADLARPTYGMCTGCGSVEVALAKVTGTRDLSAMGEAAAYPTGYGCEVCA